MGRSSIPCRRICSLIIHSITGPRIAWIMATASSAPDDVFIFLRSSSLSSSLPTPVAPAVVAVTTRGPVAYPVGIAFPQDWQNVEPAGLTAPQCGHCIVETVIGSLSLRDEPHNPSPWRQRRAGEARVSDAFQPRCRAS
jgi:hypothetical protein